MSKARKYQRWDRCQVRQHQLLVASVLLLALTGMPLRYADFKPAQSIAALLGGATPLAFFHRVGAVGLIVVLLWHFGYLLGRKLRGNLVLSMLPRVKDLTDAYELALYLVGLRPEEPRFDRYSFLEKFDYFAATGGSVLMISTGLALWFKDLALRLIGPTIWDVAFNLHSLEAVLATLFLLIGHVYHVHVAGGILPFNMVWLTGQMTAEEMKDHHPVELERLEAKAAEGDKDTDGGDGPISTR